MAPYLQDFYQYTADLQAGLACIVLFSILILGALANFEFKPPVPVVQVLLHSTSLFYCYSISLTRNQDNWVRDNSCGSNVICTVWIRTSHLFGCS
jgi:hypothetical protein